MSQQEKEAGCFNLRYLSKLEAIYLEADFLDPDLSGIKNTGTRISKAPKHFGPGNKSHL